jgi:hypothetical protein
VENPLEKSPFGRSSTEDKFKMVLTERLWEPGVTGTPDVLSVNSYVYE